jgi:hypothetical protein
MAVTMYNDYSSSAVRLKAAHPSGLVSVSGGKPQATRKFILKCKYANEIAANYSHAFVTFMEGLLTRLGLDTERQSG